MIYRDMELLWSASLPPNHLSLRVATFGATAGLIVTLADDGALTLSYLGTDPPSSGVSTEAKELNYEVRGAHARYPHRLPRTRYPHRLPEPSARTRAGDG